MSNLYLFNRAIDTALDTFKSGFSEFIIIRDCSKEIDVFLKHDSVWGLEVLMSLFNDQSQEAQVIIKTIGQFSSTERELTSLDDMNLMYPEQCNAFLGIDFSGCQVPVLNQITTLNKYLAFTKQCLPTLPFRDITELRKVLVFLFENYTFSDEALNDIMHWKLNDDNNYQKVLRLLYDVQENPFTGGLGQTEVLRNEDGIASKRINRADRVTYSLKHEKILIKRCRGHYD